LKLEHRDFTPPVFKGNSRTDLSYIPPGVERLCSE
jgi:hypothetical protein